MPKFTQEQLGAAFEMVQNPKGWKFHIHTTVDNPGPENLECVREAIIHFTGSVPTIIEKPDNKVQISAAGYYATIGP